MLNITILIALMPFFLAGEGTEYPTQQSTKMFNHCMESNQIVSFLWGWGKEAAQKQQLRALSPFFLLGKTVCYIDSATTPSREFIKAR